MFPSSPRSLFNFDQFYTLPSLQFLIGEYSGGRIQKVTIVGGCLFFVVEGVVCRCPKKVSRGNFREILRAHGKGMHSNSRLIGADSGKGKAAPPGWVGWVELRGLVECCKGLSIFEFADQVLAMADEECGVFGGGCKEACI